ncbi:MAG TPA: type II toxin-antitoxin system Phd/YefM family antitoxin, partial [Actinomycetales bacterium]|nr:type II toxin-antitoxin system Phd/YefM family antitoxin [Actinomycetales bacterium]
MYDSLTREVSVREIRRQLSETLDSVQHMKERVAVTRRGKLVGVLIPLDDFAVLEEIEDSFLIDSPIAEEFRSIATVRSLIRDFNVW